MPWCTWAAPSVIPDGTSLRGFDRADWGQKKHATFTDLIFRLERHPWKSVYVDPESLSSSPFFQPSLTDLSLCHNSRRCVLLPLVIPPNLTWLKTFICYTGMQSRSLEISHWPWSSCLIHFSLTRRPQMGFLGGLTDTLVCWVFREFANKSRQRRENGKVYHFPQCIFMLHCCESNTIDLA